MPVVIAGNIDPLILAPASAATRLPDKTGYTKICTDEFSSCRTWTAARGVMATRFT